MIKPDAILVPNLSMRGKERRMIKGEVTSPINPKPGCRFAPRCPKAKSECTSKEIEFKEVKDDHFVACTLF